MYLSLEPALGNRKTDGTGPHNWTIFDETGFALEGSADGFAAAAADAARAAAEHFRENGSTVS